VVSARIHMAVSSSFLTRVSLLLLWFSGAVSLERCPLSLMSTNEELLGKTSSGSDLESQEYSHRDPSR
jgi:hypothetical protein